MQDSQQGSTSCAGFAESAERSRQLPQIDGSLGGAPPPLAAEPDATRLASDERFWREAISTWKNILKSKPEDPETLRYLKSCQAKLVQILALLGKSEEAAEQNSALAATDRRLEDLRSKAKTSSYRAAAVLGCIGLAAATVFWLLLHGASRSTAREQVPLQENDALQPEREALVADR